MIDVICRTNLDLSPAEKWPTRLQALPSVGDRIGSAHEWGCRVRLYLQVVGIKWKPRKELDLVEWHPEIELHLPNGRFQTIAEFEEWYEKIQRGSL